MTDSCGYTRGEDDYVCLICAGHGVVSAAGDEPQARVCDVAVDELGGELCLGIGGDSIDCEDDCGAVGPGDDDAVSAPQVGKVGEHSGYAAPVDVAGDHRGPHESGDGRAGVPTGGHGLCWHFEGAVLREAESHEGGVHTYRRNPDEGGSQSRGGLSLIHISEPTRPY